MTTSAIARKLVSEEKNQAPGPITLDSNYKPAHNFTVLFLRSGKILCISESYRYHFNHEGSITIFNPAVKDINGKVASTTHPLQREIRYLDFYDFLYPGKILPEDDTVLNLAPSAKAICEKMRQKPLDIYSIFVLENQMKHLEVWNDFKSPEVFHDAFHHVEALQRNGRSYIAGMEPGDWNTTFYVRYCPRTRILATVDSIRGEEGPNFGHIITLWKKNRTRNSNYKFLLIGSIGPKLVQENHDYFEGCRYLTFLPDNNLFCIFYKSEVLRVILAHPNGTEIIHDQQFSMHAGYLEKVIPFPDKRRLLLEFSSIEKGIKLIMFDIANFTFHEIDLPPDMKEIYALHSDGRMVIRNQKNELQLIHHSQLYAAQMSEVASAITQAEDSLIPDISTIVASYVGSDFQASKAWATLFQKPLPIQPDGFLSTALRSLPPYIKWGLGLKS